MFLRPDALNSVDLLFDSMSSGRVCTTSGRELLLSLPNTYYYFLPVLSCHVVCFSRGFLLRFWNSLHIFSHSQVFPLTFLILLNFGSF
jgi:hypothetical protein